jgi:predicted aspartyl protease
MQRRICSFGATGLERYEAPCPGPADKTKAQAQRGLAGFAGQIARFAPLVLVSCTLCVSSLGGDLSVPPPKPADRVTEIPIKLYQQYLIVVDGRIGNLEHQRLLLDTGTNPSMIDQSVATKLRLEGKPRRLALFNKNVVSENVILPDLQFGPIHRQNLRVMVADFARIGRGIGTRIDAVIGLDVLGGTSFTIDYAKRQIVFRPSTEAHTAALTALQQFVTVNLESGGRQLHLLLDTGSQQLVLFQNRLRGLDYLWSPVTGSGQNVSGAFSFGTVILSQARIGTQEVGPQRASVAGPLDIEGDIDGLIGLSCLRPKRISFDFEHHVLGWSD